MTLKETDRQALIDNSRDKSHVAIENVAFLLENNNWFNKTYIKSGQLDAKYSKMIQRAFESRLEGDYNVLASFSRDEVEQAFSEMQEVIAALETFLDQEQKQP